MAWFELPLVFRMREVHQNSPAQKIKDFQVLENGNTSILKILALKCDVSIYDMEKPKKKKCPVCRSQKTESSSQGFKCNKCGYVNRPNVNSGL